MTNQKPLAEMQRALTTCCAATLLYEFVLGFLRRIVDWCLEKHTPGASLANPIGISAVSAQILLLVVTTLALLMPIFFLLETAPPSVKRNHSTLKLHQKIFFFLPIFLSIAFFVDVFATALRNVVGTSYGAAIPEKGIGLFLAFTALCIVPAVGEEILFRGAIQGCLRSYGSAPAIVGQAILFALLHVEFSQAIVALVCGTTLGLVAELTGGVQTGMILHFSNNSIAFFLLYGEQYLDSSVLGAITLLEIFFVFIWMVFAVTKAKKSGLFSQLCGLQKGEKVHSIFCCPVYLFTVAGLFAFMLWRNFHG